MGRRLGRCCRIGRCGVARGGDRRVLNGIFWVLRSYQIPLADEKSKPKSRRLTRSPVVRLSLARMDCRKPASNCSSFCSAKSSGVERQPDNRSMARPRNGIDQFFRDKDSYDPVLFPRIGIRLPGLTLGPKRLIAPALTIRDLPKIDIVLLSYAHFDHFDMRTLHRFDRSTTVITAKIHSIILRRFCDWS